MAKCPQLHLYAELSVHVFLQLLHQTREGVVELEEDGEVAVDADDEDDASAAVVCCVLTVG